MDAARLRPLVAVVRRRPRPVEVVEAPLLAARQRRAVDVEAAAAVVQLQVVAVAKGVAAVA
jgi:hypothetical protein